LANNPTPHWQPLTALPLIASLIDGELADGQEHYAASNSRSLEKFYLISVL